MARVTLPTECVGLDMADKTKYTADRMGTSIEVSDDHAHYLSKSWYGQTGVITATGYSFGTKGTQRCDPCRRDWNAWSDKCPICDQPTRTV